MTVNSGEGVLILTRLFTSSSLIAASPKISLPSWLCGFDSRHPLQICTDPQNLRPQTLDLGPIRPGGRDGIDPDARLGGHERVTMHTRQRQVGPFSRKAAATAATIWSAIATTAAASPAVISGRSAG